MKADGARYRDGLTWMRLHLVAFLRRLVTTFSPRAERAARDGAMDAELRFHIDMETERNVARGMSAPDARREALMQFGGLERTREAAWDVQRTRWLEDAWQDASHAVRLLRRSPAFAVTALLTLALGIGANTAIFSVLDAVLLRPLPYANPSDLVAFTAGRYDNYRDWTERAQTLEASGAYSYSIATVAGGSEPVRSWTLAVTASLLPTLGVSPLLGRGFTAQDDRPNAPPRVMLPYGFWQSQFGGVAEIVGRTIDVNGRAHEVIGILPPGLEFPPPARSDDGSMPITADLWTGVGWLTDLHERGGFRAVGRLAAGSSAAAASAELNAIANATLPASAERWHVPVARVDESVVAPLRPAVLAFAAAIGLVLLIACANLGSMLLARLSGRQREIAVRTSLGAPRSRIVRQIVTEGAVLAAGGAGAALGVAWLLLRALLALTPAELVRAQNATLNPRVLGVTLVLGALTALLISLLPAWSALRRTPGSALGSTRGATADRTSSRIQSLLVASEVAFAVVLLVGGGLLLRSFATLANVSPGFDTTGLVTADVLLPPDRYDSRATVLAFFDRLESRLDALPGVSDVSAIDRLPYGPSYSGISFAIVGRAAAESAVPRGSNTAARPGYFRAMGIPILQGRGITEDDATDAPPVVVIGRIVAERYWPDGDALGARIVAFGVEREVVGIAGDVRHLGPTEPVDPLIYIPQAQDITTRRLMTIVARTAGESDALLAAVRTAVRALDPQLPVSNLRSFDALREDRTAGQRFNALLVASVAALALLLATVGIYGVMSFVVAQRTREIGVRMALGATRPVVLGEFLRQAMRAVTAGAIVGLVIALPLTRLMRSMLFGVPPTDVVAYAGAMAVVALIALAAAWVPARRASRVEPRVALAGE